MSNLLVYKEKKFSVGDTITLHYLFKEGDKERKQLFKGTLIKIKGDTLENRMITVRKVSKSGIGVERVIPLVSPFLSDITLNKKTPYRKAKLYFIRSLSGKEIKAKLS